MDLCELRVNIKRFFRTKVKEYLVKNYFYLSIAAIFILSISVVGCKLNQDTKPNIIKTECEEIEDEKPIYYYHEGTYIVSENESIWKVACKYNPEKVDLTPWVETVKINNNLDGDELEQGQILKIYYYSREK